MAIGSGFVLSHWLGWILFFAVFLHKIPEGFTMASVMLAGGRGAAAALNSALFLGAMTVLGVLVINLEPAWVRVGLPLSAGVTIYVAATDLVPEVNREPGLRMALVFLLGWWCFYSAAARAWVGFAPKDMSCRTGPLRVERSLRDLYTFSGRGGFACPPVGRNRAGSSWRD
ncbi:ZIP family metal transporter [Tunturiibacter empetritectus]|uniref:ZIP family metal transporter n=1 Tax=Tunturiibacter empetritectus TaxID=3069691 RepID=UPI003D9AD6A1